LAEAAGPEALRGNITFGLAGKLIVDRFGSGDVFT
jgi:hypothetical protein